MGPSLASMPDKPHLLGYKHRDEVLDILGALSRAVGILAVDFLAKLLLWTPEPIAVTVSHA
jgi:hypothetical protein